MDELSPPVVPHEDRHTRIRDTMRGAGAISPATAKPRAALVPLPKGYFEWALEKGTVREAAPGTFYLFESPISPQQRRKQIIVSILLWIILAAVPIVLLRLNR